MQITLYNTLTRKKENTKLWSTPDGGKYDIPTETCTEHKAPEQVEVPDVIGKKEADAKKTLQDKGLKVEVKYSESDKTSGIVLSQSKKEGEKVDKDTTITITVSKKKEDSNPGKTNTVDKGNTQTNSVVDKPEDNNKTNTNDENE